MSDIFQFPVTLETPWARTVNEQIESAQKQQAQSYASVYNAFLTSYSYDAMNGKVIPGTEIRWEASTECQSLIHLWYTAQSVKTPEDYQAYLETYSGPVTEQDWWNGSYNYFGIPPHTNPSDLIEQREDAILRSNAMVSDVLLPPK